jgi:pimeloyl-ACP methyl ester carboxylesterase
MAAPARGTRRPSPSRFVPSGAGRTMFSFTRHPWTSRASWALLILSVLVLVGVARSATAQAESTCPGGMSCGSVTVPLDRQNPSAGTIDIHYALVPHTDTSRPSAGTIVPNPGGPGIATIGSAGLYVHALAPLRRNRDLLLIDARGTGQSEAVTCPSLSSHDPLSLYQQSVWTTCGGDLGARAGLYGSAAVADDIDAVRASLGLHKLDLWGDSYGTFLMPVYAARYPEHVRSVVLDGAFPIASDRWGRDVLRGVRRVIGLVCQRTQRCSGPRVLTGIGRLARRLRHHPVHFTANSPVGAVRLTLSERELADVTYGGGDPAVYGLLPAAVRAALDHDFAPLERLVTVSRIDEVGGFLIDPTLLSNGAGGAVSCHDYPRPYDLAAPPAQRRAEYHRAVAHLDAAQFRPFSPRAWLATEIDAGPKCLGWPADPSAGSPLEGRPIPDVPVLVQSGDLDTDTPIEQGRRAAAQFPHPVYGIVANAGHTPDLHRCGVAMAVEFVEHLKTDTNRCLHAGHPPHVVGRPPLHAAQLRLPHKWASKLRRPHVHAAVPVRRAVAVLLATLADERRFVAYSGLTGTIDALRGGTYTIGQDRAVRFDAARVVTDATANGTLQRSSDGKRVTLRLSGRAVRRSQLTLRSTGSATRITGMVGHHQVDVRVTK